MSRCLCYLKTMRKRSLLLDCCLRSLLREQQAVIWWVCRESRVPWLTNIFSRLSIFFFLLHFAYIYAFPALVLMYREPPELVWFQSSQNWAWFDTFLRVSTVRPCKKTVIPPAQGIILMNQLWVPHLQTLEKRSWLVDHCLGSILWDHQAVVWWVHRESRALSLLRDWQKMNWNWHFWCHLIMFSSPYHSLLY